MTMIGKQSYKVKDFGLDDRDSFLGFDWPISGKITRFADDFRNVGFFNYAFIDDYAKWFSKDYIKAVKMAFECGVSAIHNNFWFIRAKGKNKVYVKSFTKKKFIACWQ